MVTIEKNWTNYESELNNVDQWKWPSIKMPNTLGTLNSADSAYSKESFYKANDEKVEYDMGSVKAYLKKLADTANYWEFVKEVNKWNWWLLNLAAQIALETLGYDIGKIDWLVWPRTKWQIRKFQEDAWFKWKDVDGVIWPKTIKALLEKLWEPADNNNGTDNNGTDNNGTDNNGTDNNGTDNNGTDNNEGEPNKEEVLDAEWYTAKTGVKVNVWGKLTPDELIEWLDCTEDSVQFDPVWTEPILSTATNGTPRQITVKIKKNGNEYTINCSYEVV